MQNHVRTFLLVLLCVAALASGAVSPETVVATVNGEELTAGDVDRILTGAPADMQEMMQKNRRQFVQQYALVSQLAREAEENQLYDKKPYRERLAWSRMQVLLQAAISDRSGSLKKEALEQADLEEAMKQWLDGLRESVDISYENDDFFSEDLRVASGVDLDVVVVKLNGKPLTAGEIRDTVAGTSPQVLENFKADRKRFLHEYGMMLRLVEYAEEKGLDSESPYREQLAWVRSNILSQARMNEATYSVTVEDQDLRDYFEAHKDDYTQAKVKVLYVSFGSGDSVGKEFGGKVVLSEDEAKQKIQSLREQVIAGADFIALIKEHSDDKSSKAQDGDFGTISRSAQIPDNIKDVVFALKSGELSEPVRQPNGYYLFRVEETGTLAFEDVRTAIRQKVRGAKFDEWFESARKSVKVTFENDEYFDGAGK